MDLVVTLVAPAGAEISAEALAALAGAGLEAAPVWLAPGRACDLTARGDREALAGRVRAALAPFAVDHAVLPAQGRRKRLLVADMDSTIIGQECIDELARVAGVGEEVAAITARAMTGEIDFEGAFVARAALLAGAPVSAIDRILAERITINDGARALVATMRAHGAHTILVSGGISQFVKAIAARLGFDETRANDLDARDGRFTGKAVTPVLGRRAKVLALQETCARLGIGADGAAAVGDGANDVELIESVGLGVAYRAQPALADRARARIDHGDLTALLFFQGYRSDEFVGA